MHSAYSEISGSYNGVPYEADHQECNTVLFGVWVPAQWFHFL